MFEAGGANAVGAGIGIAIAIAAVLAVVGVGVYMYNGCKPATSRQPPAALPSAATDFETGGSDPAVPTSPQASGAAAFNMYRSAAIQPRAQQYLAAAGPTAQPVTLPDPAAVAAATAPALPPKVRQDFSPVISIKA